MPLCTCGHEQHEHPRRPCLSGGWASDCERCTCLEYTERPVLTQSHWDLPVGQGALDLWERMRNDAPLSSDAAPYVLLDILAAADERDVRTLLWARRTGRL